MSENWTNRTMWTGDNLDIMRGMNSASVDLIYLDPPFNSNKTYSAPIGSDAAGASFKDTWTLSDVDEAWHGEIAEANEAVYEVIRAAGVTHGKGMKSYLMHDGGSSLGNAPALEANLESLPPLRPDSQSLSQDVARCCIWERELQKRDRLVVSTMAVEAAELSADARYNLALFSRRLPTVESAL